MIAARVNAKVLREYMGHANIPNHLRPLSRAERDPSIGLTGGIHAEALGQVAARRRENLPVPLTR